MIPLAAMPPWLWKAGLGAALVVVLFAGYKHRLSVAYDEGHAAAINERATADLVGVVGRVRENDADLIKFTSRNVAITKAKDEELAPVVQRIYVDRVRVGKAICDGPASTASTEGASGGDGADPAGRLVPQRTEEDLRALTAAVEKHFATGRACQRFASDNGLVP